MKRGAVLRPQFMIGLLFGSAVFAHGDYDKGQNIEIVSPQQGAVVRSPVTVTFQAKGVKIKPAGVDKHDSGHFHLLIDQAVDATVDEPMQPSRKHLRLIEGEMKTVLELNPGRHTLQLVVADEEHTPFENLVSPMVTIQVKQ